MDVRPAVPQRDLLTDEQDVVVTQHIIIGSPARVGELPIKLDTNPVLRVPGVGPDPPPSNPLPPLPHRTRQPVSVFDTFAILQLQVRLNPLVGDLQHTQDEATMANPVTPLNLCQ